MKYFDIFTRLLFDDFTHFMKRMKINFTNSGVFFKLNALKMSEITIFDVIVEEVVVLTSFLKILLELSAYLSFITKTGNTTKYK
jgi:hypothetical protein